jgi:hypothetical protein
VEIPPELIAAKRLVEPALMMLPGIVGVGIGLFEQDEEFFDELAFKVLVEDKLNLPEGIPEEVGGVQVCIVERSIEPCLNPDASRYADLKGGIQVSEPLHGFGTLGAIVQDRVSGELLGLTCQHVVGDPGSAFPGGAWQPTDPFLPVGVTPNPADFVGSVLRSDFPNTPPLPFSPLLVGLVDAAVFQLQGAVKAGRTRSAAIAGETPQPPSLIDKVTATAWPGKVQRVQKRGFQTRVTHGTVVTPSLTCRCDPQRPERWLIDQSEIFMEPSNPAKGINPDGVFCVSGDSGSLVLAANSPTALGLLWGASIPGAFATGGKFGYMSAITNVELQLDVSVAWA